MPIDDLWRSDYSHTETKTKKYPDGMCGRPLCWPCTARRLEAGNGQTWEGAARMAAARRAVQGTGVSSTPTDDSEIRAVGERMGANLELDKRDAEALRHVPDPSVLSKKFECYKEPDQLWRVPSTG